MIHINYSQSEVPSWIVAGVVVYLILWVWSLTAVLAGKGKDHEIEKLTWVVVLIFVPVVGLILYALYGPGATEGAAKPEKKAWEVASREWQDPVE